MKIAVIGAGAMGTLYGGYLSKKNIVLLVGTNEEKMNIINQKGITIYEPDGSITMSKNIKGIVETSKCGYVDLVILFVKSMYSKEALETNIGLIGPDTYILTLQNGA